MTATEFETNPFRFRFEFVESITALHRLIIGFMWYHHHSYHRFYVMGSWHKVDCLIFFLKMIYKFKYKTCFRRTLEYKNRSHLVNLSCLFHLPNLTSFPLTISLGFVTYAVNLATSVFCASIELLSHKWLDWENGKSCGKRLFAAAVYSDTSYLISGCCEMSHKNQFLFR